MVIRCSILIKMGLIFRIKNGVGWKIHLLPSDLLCWWAEQWEELTASTMELEKLP